MRKFIKKRRLNEDMSLQITSMADIFMILLVFLLKSYATGMSNITPSKDMVLPEAASQDEMKEALKVEVGADSILVDQKPAVQLQNFAFKPGDIRADGGSQSLYRALMMERKNQKLAESESSLLVMADQDAPYSTIKAVLASAASSGFIDLKLVVVKVE